MDLSKKIIFGTANLTQRYGINKKKLLNNKEKINLLLLKLIKKKINIIDTAIKYNSEKEIGNFSSNFSIINKIVLNKRHVKLKQLELEVRNSLKKLKKKKLYGLLIHNPLFLKNKNGKLIFKNLKKIKKLKLTKKIGFSIYSPNELKVLFKKFKPDIVQFPINLFDQRIIETGWIDILKRNKIETHGRSIFLQGLLLKKKNNIPKKFKSKNKYFDNFFYWLKKNNLSNLDSCLNFAFSRKKIDKLIIGVDNIDQLKKILNYKKSKIQYNYDSLKVSNTKIIDPQTW